jgi:hypothetical protein
MMLPQSHIKYGAELEYISTKRNVDVALPTYTTDITRFGSGLLKGMVNRDYRVIPQSPHADIRIAPQNGQQPLPSHCSEYIIQNIPIISH